MNPVAPFRTTLALFVSLVGASGRSAEPIAVDLSDYHPESGVAVRRDGDHLTLEWPMDDETGQLVLDLTPGRPLIRSMGIVGKDGRAARILLEGADPTTFLLVGSRQAPTGRPPGMSEFNVFFDTPANRPFKAFPSRLDPKRAKVSSKGARATVAIGDLSIGSFAGELLLSVYRGARLIHVESVVRTGEDRRAILYDAGLAVASPESLRFAWVDTEGKPVSLKPAPETADRHLAVRHRALVAETGAGSIACFPPPHQYFSPRDQTDNLKTVWYGRGHRGARKAVRFRHLPGRARGRVVGSLVQRTARQPPAPGGLLSALQRQCPESPRANAALHPRGPISQPAGLPHAHQPLAHGDYRSRPARKGEGRHAIDP